MPKKDESMTTDPNAPMGAITGPSDPGNTPLSGDSEERGDAPMSLDEMRRNAALNLSVQVRHDSAQAALRSAKLFETYLRDGTVPE